MTSAVNWPIIGAPFVTTRMIGQTVSHYRIVDSVGSGGMGVVYRAEDLRLGRTVALKFLPDHIRDAVRHRRFVVEAQAASSLDHPNICTIFEIDETPDGRVFIAMAYYGGETLRDRIARGIVSTELAVRYAVQIAEGLAAANKAGIVHRDIKPANVLITSEGLLKIVDFGLAKLTGQTDLTQTGQVVGTPQYMAPEQITGGTVDGRADVWALGVVLYEMLTGRHPFDGDTPSAVLHAIVHQTLTPLHMLRGGIESGLEDVVRRALAKDPASRYPSAAALATDLQRLLAGKPLLAPTTTANNAPVDHAPRSRRNGVAARRVAAVVVAAAAIGAGWLLWNGRGEPTRGVRLANPRQLAASVGLETQPSWSADGTLVAYHSDQSGNNDVWVAQVGGSVINRTADHQGADEMPRVSPDGRQIAFWSARDGGGYFVMPVLAGSPRKVAAGRPSIATAAVWSPDGSELAYTLAAGAGSPPRVERRKIRDGTTRQIAFRSPAGGAFGCLDLSWSPDGQFIACVQGNSYNHQTTRLWVIRLSDEQVIALTDNRLINWSPIWSPDSRTLFFTSNRGSTMDLWMQALADDGNPAGEAERVTTGLDLYQAALTADGSQLAYARGRRIANVWRLPIPGPDRVATWADAQQVTFDTAWVEAISLAKDGARLAIQSDRLGNHDIWILPARGGEMLALTTDPSVDWWPDWSPDGREIAFYSLRTGTRENWIQTVEGGAARRLLAKPDIHTFPKWAADGTLIFHGVNAIYATPASGGEPRLVLGEGGALLAINTQDFSPSPDGEWFAFASGVLGGRRIWKARVSGADATQLSRGQGTAPCWSPDGRTVYYTSMEGTQQAYTLDRTGINLWRLNADGTGERALTDLTTRRGFLGPNVATDGKWLYFTWREDVSDIWIMDVVR